MRVSRRGVLRGLLIGGLSASTALAADRAVAEVQNNGPLPFYGGPGSGVRPDRCRPAATTGVTLWQGATTQRLIALTFDDGPRPNWTPTVLRTLEKKQAPATFFLVGSRVAEHPDLAKQVAASPLRHDIGGHSWSHHDLARMNYDQARTELSRTSEAVKKHCGRQLKLFRPPYGHFGAATSLAAAELGLTTVMWSAQFKESEFIDHPKDLITDIRKAVHPGAIVLAHDVGPEERLIAINQLGDIIDAWRADGYRLVTVSQLLRESTSRPA